MPPSQPERECRPEAWGTCPVGAGSCTSVLNRSERGLAKAESRAYPGLEAVVSPTNATYADKRGAVPWKIRVRLLK